MTNSSDHQPFSPNGSQSEDESIPRLQRTIHPDAVQFMGMAKELLESPAVQQAVENEQKRQQDDQ